MAKRKPRKRKKCDAATVAARVEEIRHQQKPPVPRDIRCYGLALDRDAALLLPRRQADDADIIVKAVAGIQGFAVWAGYGSHGSVADGDGGELLTRRSLEHEDTALRCGASDVEPASIGRKSQARG